MAEAQKIAELEKQLQRQLAKQAEAEDKAKAALDRATKAKDASTKLQAAIDSTKGATSQDPNQKFGFTVQGNQTPTGYVKTEKRERCRTLKSTL